MMQPLCVLTQKTVNTAQHKAFVAIKQAVSEMPVLRYYDLDKQNGQPVAYASHSLMNCET